MLTTEVRKISDRKVRVLFDDGLSLVLYRAEAGKLGIRAGEDISDDTVRYILDDILRKRSRLRCLNLLKTSDRTVKQLRERLAMDGYPEETISQALDYVASYHYTDDFRYACNYVRLMSGRKSGRQIEYELLRKGVDRNLIRAALSEDEDQMGDAQTQAIMSLARKRGYDSEHAGREETMKFIRYLLGKGFDLPAIHTAVGSSAGREYLD